MATTPTHAQALFNVPFSHNTDFTELANHCERFACTLLETDDPAEKLALCARLSGCLYCQTLTQLLISNALPRDMAKVMEGLLYELVNFYADTLNAPRWLLTPDGRVAIDALID